MTAVLPTDPAVWVDRLAPRRHGDVWRRVSRAGIARELGLSDRALERHLRRIGVPARLTSPPPPPPEDATEAEAVAWLAQVTRPEGRCQRWVFQWMTHRPYPVTYVDGRRRPVNRLVWSWHHGPLGDGLDVVRSASCAFADCVRPEHLRAVAVPERIEEQVDRRAFAHGQVHWNARLDEDQARSILESSDPVQETAASFGVSPSTVVAIRTGRRWKHLGQPTA